MYNSQDFLDDGVDVRCVIIVNFEANKKIDSMSELFFCKCLYSIRSICFAIDAIVIQKISRFKK